jgi:hypothetical protein
MPKRPEALRLVAFKTWDAPAPLRFWHLASLDAPTVAIAWSLAFAWTAQIHLPPWIPVLLALGTWTAYISDRLLDARAGLRSGSFRSLRERHFFHWRHRRIFLVLSAAAACAAIAIIFGLMSAPIRTRNSVLAVAALAYFSSVHSLRQPYRHLRTPISRALHSRAPHFKELLVGMLFTAGCALPTLSRMNGIVHPNSFQWPILAAFALFAALAWLNCHAIERWESNPTPSSIPAVAIFLGSIAALLANFLVFAEPRVAALLAACTFSALFIATLDYFRNRLTPLALRAAADLVLLTPLILLAR